MTKPDPIERAFDPEVFRAEGHRLVDRLTAYLAAVDGTAVLDGSLDLSLIGDFTPDVSDVFTILTVSGGALSGVFANAASQASFAEGSFDVTYTSSSVTLSNFLPIPEPSTAILVLVGLLVLSSRQSGSDSDEVVGG